MGRSPDRGMGYICAAANSITAITMSYLHCNTCRDRLGVNASLGVARG